MSIEFLASTVKESHDLLEDWILDGISDGSLRVKIDDIEKVLYSVEPNCVSSTVTRTLDYIKRSYDTSVLKLINLSASSKYNDTQVDIENMKPYIIDSLPRSISREYHGMDDEIDIETY